MRAHISFDLYVPEGVCTFAELEQWFHSHLEENLKARDLLGLRRVARDWTLSGVDVVEQ